MQPEHIATIREAVYWYKDNIYLEVDEEAAIDAALAALDKLTPLDMPDGPGIVTGADDANAV